MRSIVVIAGSPRPKGNTYKIVRQVQAELEKRGTVNVETVQLQRANIQYCRGCMLCMKRGEGRCPCRDELLAIRDKMREADGVVFACPVYVHGVPAVMKNFYDRLAFQCHQPAYLDKAALLVTTTELSGSRETLEYMEFVAFTWGFRIAGKLAVCSGYEHEGAYRKATERLIDRAASQLWAAMSTPRPAPTMKELAFFNLMRTKVTLHRQQFPRDYEYWRERGWLARPYYYDVSIPAAKSLLTRTMVRARVRRMLRDAGLDQLRRPADVAS